MVEAALAAAVGAGLWYAFRVVRNLDVSATHAERPAGSSSHSRLRRGDVILYVGSEAWLSERLLLEEDGPLLELFSCPGCREADWVGVLSRTPDRLLFLNETARSVGAPLSSTLVLDGIRFGLDRKGTATTQREGSELPDLGPKVEWHLYAALPDRVAVIVQGEQAELTLVGRRVSQTLVEVLPGESDVVSEG